MTAWGRMPDPCTTMAHSPDSLENQMEQYLESSRHPGSGSSQTAPGIAFATMSQVKSKQRVADHGEVFTPAWMVEAMLDKAV